MSLIGTAKSVYCPVSAAGDIFRLILLEAIYCLIWLDDQVDIGDEGLGIDSTMEDDLLLQ